MSGALSGGLQWIRGTSCKWEVFVANRVAEIQSTWDSQHWTHCSEEDNPTDLLTADVFSKVLAKNDLWCNGSNWLATSYWPNKQQLTKELSVSIEKERNSSHIKTCAAIATVPMSDPS